jgi:N-methylhydantoinase B
VRQLRFLGDAQLTLLTERRTVAPFGLAGGGSGRVGRNVLARGGRWRSLPAKINLEVQEGDVLRVETPGGGGFGSSTRKDRRAPRRVRRPPKGRGRVRR